MSDSRAKGPDTGPDTVRALPLWKGPVDPEPLHGGLSNESFTVTDAGERYVVRLGLDLPFHHVQREHEVMVTRAAHAAGFAPELVYTAPGVMVSRFIEGVTYDAPAVCRNIEPVARLVRGFHRKMPNRVSGSAHLFWPFHVVRDYARTLDQANSRYASRLPAFLGLSDQLEALQVPLPIVFGHHDLLPANFIHDGHRLWLIDFEYAAFSTPMFDLAGAVANAGADAATARRFLDVYFEDQPGVVVDDLLRSHGAMQCAALLREAMWSMVSELHMAAPGVDYVAYAEENLQMLESAIGDFNARFEQGLPQP